VSPGRATLQRLRMTNRRSPDVFDVDFSERRGLLAA
jgi:hypothetical protein